MQVQPIIKTQKTFKLILSDEEKKQRKAQIETMVSQVVAISSEHILDGKVDINKVRKLVTKKYDALIRRKVLDTI